MNCCSRAAKMCFWAAEPHVQNRCTQNYEWFRKDFALNIIVPRGSLFRNIQAVSAWQRFHRIHAMPGWQLKMYFVIWKVDKKWRAREIIMAHFDSTTPLLMVSSNRYNFCTTCEFRIEELNILIKYFSEMFLYWSRNSKFRPKQMRNNAKKDRKYTIKNKMFHFITQLFAAYQHLDKLDIVDLAVSWTNQS